ncbi:MAG: DUF2069 domain-containing protein [Gammaproteobacteria bacterium]|nr:DUF2069 domain-containing protein [Gammaproteobacteria bacterium]
MKAHFSGRALALSAMVLLAAWLCLWLVALTQANIRERVVWMSLALLPLLLVAYPVWRGQKAGFAWCGFLALGYFAQGITVLLTSKSDGGYASMEVSLSLLLFIAASAALRGLRRNA